MMPLMSSRRHNRTLRRVAIMAALAALLAPAGAAEAKTKKKVPAPVVTSVSPMDAEVGDTLTIRGRNFKRGRGRNTVVFKRDGARAVFVKADIATAKLMKVKVPSRLVEFMANQGTAKVPTVFRVRILASRFGKRFTPASKSPRIGPDNPPPPPAPPVAAAAEGDCDGDGVLNRSESDDDADGLSDDVELSLQLDPCKVDTDGDGLEDRWEYDCDRNGTLNRDQADDDSDLLPDSLEGEIFTDPCSADSDGDSITDGYEYRSAIDLNDDSYQDPNQSLPYPSGRPYPNPLFKDAETDYDGDGLWLVDEFNLWRAYGDTGSLSNVLYSDGKQFSRDVATVGYDKQAQFLAAAAAKGYGESLLLNMNGGSVPGFSGVGGDYDSFINDGVPGEESDSFFARDDEISDVERYYYDQDYNGRLSDDERDEDGDGLSNWQEAHGFGQPGWWVHVYGQEQPYVNQYSGTDLTKADTDKDGVVDGADDNDFDDLPNVREIRRQLVAGEYPDGELNYYTSDPADTYSQFQMGENPDSIRWNRPQEGAPESEPLDSGPWRAWVQPFNPCLPDPRSRTCERYPNLSALYPPFNADTPVFNVFDGQFWTAE